jgi:hypothetical protein
MEVGRIALQASENDVADERPLTGAERFALQACVFLLLYAIAVWSLIVWNTDVLGLGDVDLGGSTGQLVYFALWGLFFSPAVFAAIFGLWMVRARPLFSWLLAGGCLVFILLVLEGCFVLDAHFALVLLANLVLVVSFGVGGVAAGERSNQTPAS